MLSLASPVVPSLATSTVAKVGGTCGSMTGEWKKKTRPFDDKARRMAVKREASLLTARTVTKSMRWGRTRSTTSSNLWLSTSVSRRSRARTASRRNAAFRAFDSIIVNLARGCAIFIGMAGEPPPDPTSSHRRAESATYSAAANGSMSNRSNVSSLGRRKGRAVRLTFAFHRVSSLKYTSSRDCASAVIDTPAFPARADKRPRNSLEVTERGGRHKPTGRRRQLA